jgi:aldehyde:ferredoxin oxidoreductase
MQAEMADAAKEAKNATKATEEGGDNLADGLKEMAEMVKGKNKATAAALEKMAADLEDGASPEELDRIQAAMKVAAQSQNKAFADLGKAMDQQASNIEEAAQMAAEALKKTKALEAKIRSMRTGA